MEDKFGKLISKKEIASLLEVSERTIQRLSSKKQIITVYQKKFHGGKIAFFPLSEVERIKEAWEKKTPLPVVEEPILETEQKNTAKQMSDKPKEKKSVDLIESVLEEKTTTKLSAKHEISVLEAAAKLILTVQEVSMLTHIPEKELREDLKKGKLRGLFKGHGWKVKRADLEDYVKNIYVPRRSDVIEDSGTNEIDLGDFGQIEYLDE